MKILTKRKLILFFELVIPQILSFILPKINTQNSIMKTFLEYAIIIGLAIGILIFVFQLLYWRYTYMYNSIKKQKAINKFITIMILRFESNYPNHPCSVFEHDMDNLFSKDEWKYIASYLQDKERLKIIMRGKNKVFGQEL